jgi:predicted Zn-dependent peptidase
VTIYYKHLPWAPCVHMRWSFSAGAFADPIGKEGVAHFLEHLIGNGSPLLPDKKAVKEFSRIYMLNSRNAFTSHYATAYVGRCLPENFARVMEVMKDYIFNPFLRPEDVEHERKVITQEAWGRYKNEKFLRYIKEFSQNVYGGHIRERIASPLGWPETVAKISREDIKEFHAKKYVKENLSIFLIGAVTEVSLDNVREFLKGIPSGAKSSDEEGAISKPRELTSSKFADEIGNPSEQLTFSILRAMDLPTTERQNEIGNHAKMLIYDIFFERMRLEHSLCYGVEMRWIMTRSYAEVGVTIDTSEEKLELAQKEAWELIREITDGKWEARFETLHKLAIDQIKSQEWLSDNVAGKAMNDLYVFGRTLSIEEILAEAEKVTYADVRDFIKEAFDPAYVLTEVIHPSKK